MASDPNMQHSPHPDAELNPSSDFKMDRLPEAVWRHAGELGSKWGWFLALGIGLIVLGAIGLGMTFAATIISVMYFGVLMFIGGIMEFAHLFATRKWGGILLQLLTGILYLVAGAYMFFNPLQASVILTLVLGLAIIFTGLFRMALAVLMRPAHTWGWVLFSGVISLILGGVILAGWPATSLWVIGLFVAVELLLNGWSLVMLGVAVHTIRPAEPTVQPMSA